MSETETPELLEPKKEPVDVEPEPVKSGFSCDECGAKYPSNYALKEHIDIAHKGLKDHTCDVCQKSFGRKSGLVKHLKFVHEKQKSYKCLQCNVAYPYQHELKNHIKTVHGNPKRFPCDLCSSTFKRKYDLSAHKKYVHEKSKPFLCPFCAKEIARKADLETHIRLVHDQLKPYYCDQCGKSFGTLPNLRTHVKDVHVKIANIPCPKCDKMFISYQRQRDHIKYVHDKVREHQCDFCDKRLETKFKKFRHIRQVHEKTRNFECSLCDKGYTREGDLEIHHQIAHVEPEPDAEPEDSADMYQAHEVNYFNHDDDPGDSSSQSNDEEITIEGVQIFFEGEMDQTDSTGDESTSGLVKSKAHNIESVNVNNPKVSSEVLKIKLKTNPKKTRPASREIKVEHSDLMLHNERWNDSERARFVHHQSTPSTSTNQLEMSSRIKSENCSNILEVFSTTHSKEPITNDEWNQIEQFLIDQLTDEISCLLTSPQKVKTSRSGYDQTKMCGVIMVKNAESKAWYQTSVSRFNVDGKKFRVWSMDEVPEVYQVRLILPARLNRIDDQAVMKLLLSFNPQLEKLKMSVKRVEEIEDEGRAFDLEVCRDIFEVIKHKDWKLEFLMGEVECKVE
jgi:KRAB domain-containing zinc finger protein